MYAQLPRNGDTHQILPNGLHYGMSNSITGSNGRPIISEGFLASLSFLIILLTVTVVCLSFIKKSVSYFTGQKQVQRTVQCTRISVISDSGTMQVAVDLSRFFPINEFRQHYKSLASDSYYQLAMEFESLKVRGEDLKPRKEGDRTCNRQKNRFVNVLPFDDSRYCLNLIPGVPGSDYINANHVSGYYTGNMKPENREYIATQGPLENTVDDFWRMTWESGSRCIVMLTVILDRGSSDDDDLYEKYNMNLNLRPRNPFMADREKCYRYWPDCCVPVQYGDIEVEVVTERLEGYRSTSCTNKWVISELKLRYNGQERDLRHYQFTTWPDFETVDPPEALVHFVREVRKWAPYPSLGKPVQPVIIHCSAGIGRTGTFIAVDTVMGQIKNKKAISIPSIVNNLRSQRVWMVQTEHQYICIYKCAVAILNEQLEGYTKHTNFTLTPSNDTPAVTGPADSDSSNDFD